MDLTEEQEEILRLLTELDVREDQILLAMQSIEDPKRAEIVIDKLLDWEDKGNKITKQKIMEILVRT